MATRRAERAQDLIMQEISRLLLLKAKDPLLRFVSVTGVQMTGDLRKAKVRYSIFDDSIDRIDMQKRLEKATGFIRREVGHNLVLKYVPEIQFEFDKSLEYAQHIDHVLKDIFPDSGDLDDDVDDS